MKTAKEVANFLGYPIAKDLYSTHQDDRTGSWVVFEKPPVIDVSSDIWKPQKNSWWKYLQPGLVGDCIDWKESLTFPDNWDNKTT